MKYYRSANFVFEARMTIIDLQQKKSNMKKAQNQFQKTLTRLSISEKATFSIEERNEVRSEVESLNSEINGYQFEISPINKKTGSFHVTRVLPGKMIDRAKYVDSIKKTTINQALRSNNWNKEKSASSLNISARTLGRLIRRYDIAERKSAARVNA